MHRRLRQPVPAVDGQLDAREARHPRMPFGRLVVSLDGSRHDAALVAYAGLIARLGRTREVRMVRFAADDASATARRALRGLVADALDAPYVTVACDVLHGPPAHCLLGCLVRCGADLLLVGDADRPLLARLAMGAPCPLAVLPAGCEPPVLTHLAVAVDFSDAATGAFDWAARLAGGDLAIRCTALHVVTPESATHLADGGDDAHLAPAVRALQRHADRYDVTVEPRLAKLCGTPHPRSAARVTREADDVARTLLAEAERCGADAVAVGTRGWNAAAPLLIGRVARAVLEQATVPLFVHRAPGQPPDPLARVPGRDCRHAALTPH